MCVCVCNGNPRLCAATPPYGPAARLSVCLRGARPLSLGSPCVWVEPGGRVAVFRGRGGGAREIIGGHCLAGPSLTHVGQGPELQISQSGLGPCQCIQAGVGDEPGVRLLSGCDV